MKDITFLLSRNTNPNKVCLLCVGPRAFTKLIFNNTKSQLKEFARRGMSKEMRRRAWPQLACAVDLTKRCPQLYEVRPARCVHRMHIEQTQESLCVWHCMHQAPMRSMRYFVLALLLLFCCTNAAFYVASHSRWTGCIECLIVQLLLQQGRSMEYDSVIVADVGRAIPTHPYFGTAEAPGCACLVVVAHTHLNAM